MIKHDYKPSSASKRHRANQLLDNHTIKAKLLIIVGLSFLTSVIFFWLISGDTDSDNQIPVSYEIALNTDDKAQKTIEVKQNSTPNTQKEIPLPLNNEDIPQPIEYQSQEPSIEALNTDIDKSVQVDNKERNLLIDLPLHFDAPDPITNVATPSQPEYLYTKVKKGDNLSEIFKRIGISAKDLIRLVKSSDDSKPLINLMPGNQIGYIKDSVGLHKLSYQINDLTTLFAERNIENPTTYDIKIEEKTVEIRQNFASGIIEDNLFAAGYKAGLSDKIIMELANIFGWDIDFALDIRKGDSFTFMFEEKYVDAELIGTGKILAAEFINQGDRYRAVLYEDKDGNKNYYTPNGFSMRKAFLRAPLNFSYISSSFKPKRFHPVLKRWKAHNGIDYGAPRGTPVYAAGDGRVLKAGYSKYNGNYVFIQHGQKYVTRYLHFSKKAVKTGQKVRQKQIIGYVGSTGLATGPHLHYEFLVNGVHRNPRTVSLPQAKPVPKKEQARFFEQTKSLIAALDVSSRILLAQNGQ